MRSISLEIVRVTEAASIAAYNWIGSGSKIEADKAATEAMRHRLNQMDFAGRVAIGEGIKDSSVGLFRGECVGTIPFGGHVPSAGSVADTVFDRPKLYELAVDPIEGTTPVVTSGPEAISVLAVANEGCMFHTSHFYMKKLAYGPKIRSKVRLSLNDSLERTLELISASLHKPLSDIVVCILDRPRHASDISQLRTLGVKIKLIKDCDVSGGIASCLEDSGVDLLYGIGGSPEAIISACASKCLKGDFQAQVVDEKMNPISKVLGMEELVMGPCLLAATGITNGSFLRGVRRSDAGMITNSVFMRSESHTVRWLETHHGN